LKIGVTSAENAECLGCPLTSRTDKNMAQVKARHRKQKNYCPWIC